MAFIQSSSAPTRKVTFGGAAGAISTITVFILNSFVLSSEHQIPSAVAGALATLLSFGIAYMVSPAETDSVVSDMNSPAETDSVVSEPEQQPAS